MKRRHNFILLLLLLILALVTFLWWKYLSKSSINAELPPKWEFQNELTPEPSYINSTIKFSLREIANVINKEIPIVLLMDDSFEKDNLLLNIKRTGDLKIRMNGDSLFYEVPLSVFAKYRVDTKKFFIKIKADKEIDANVVIGLKSKISLKENWSIQTKTIATKFQWTKEPVLDFGVFQVNISEIANQEFKRFESRLTRLIDSTVSNKVNLRAIADKQWKGLQKPILLTKRPNKIWLLIQPNEIFADNVYSDNNLVYVNTAINANLKTTIADTLIIEKISAIPKIKKGTKNKNSFDLNLISTIPFSDINKVLNDSLKGKVIKFQSKKIKLKEIKVFASGKGVALKLKVSGDIHGILYLYGKLEIDSALSQVKISDFNYSVSTESKIATIAEWIFHSDLLKQISGKLNYQISTKINLLPLLIQDALEKGKLGEATDIKIKNMKFYFKGISIQEENIQILINASGEINTRVYINSNKK